MNQFLKNLGIVFIIISTIILGYYMMNNPEGNALLILATILLVGGVAVHIIINRIID